MFYVPAVTLEPLLRASSNADRPVGSPFPPPDATGAGAGTGGGGGGAPPGGGGGALPP